jgi:hypothetical protein
MHHPPLADNPLRTRADLQRSLLDLWAPVRPFLVRDGASLSLGATAAHYGEPAAFTEAFARPLWGLAPLAAGGGHFPDWPLVRAALIEGTDPTHPRFWGVPLEVDQRLVEMAALAVALVLARAELWEPLSPAQRAHVLTWLGHINHRKLADNNWRFFRVLVNDTFAALGGPVSESRLTEDLTRIDEFYLRDGWYADGQNGNRDYYVPMALHYYGLIHTRLSAGGDPTHSARYTERARHFAPRFAAWFAADGSALPYGRSLTYRFAQGAFWGACAYAGIPALPWGEMKHLYLQHLRWWFRQPIFTETGLLSIGYAYPNIIHADIYNAPGSPYWALTAYLPLALPDTHPFWTAEETPPAAHRSTTISVQAPARQILVRDAARDHVYSLCGHSAPVWDPRHTAQKYSKFAYSTAFGFGVPIGGTSPTHGGGDSTLLLSDDGEDWRTRVRCTEPAFDANSLHTSWTPWPDVTIDTWLVAAPPGHLRIHRIKTARALRSFEGGFSVGRRTADRPAHEAPGRADFAYPHAYTGIADPSPAPRAGSTVNSQPNSHLLFPLSVIPGLRGEHPPGVHWLITAVIALPGPDQAPPGRAWLDAFAVRYENERPVLTGPDGFSYAVPAPHPPLPASRPSQ